jgi:hypothetical protein
MKRKRSPQSCLDSYPDFLGRLNERTITNSPDTDGDFTSLAAKWMFDVIGATHPIRLSLVIMGAMGMQTVATVVYAAIPTQRWLEAISLLPAYQVVGFVFIHYLARYFSLGREFPSHSRSN